MVAANPNQNGNPNQDTGVKPHPERIARKLKIFFPSIFASPVLGWHYMVKIFEFCCITIFLNFTRIIYY